jgi:hypothetical protein
MWRKARNVRITYKIIPPANPNDPIRLDDEVTNEPKNGGFMQVKSIKGVDTPDGVGSWKWRGKGLLMIASSHWEILGWGERDGERWVVTWFAPSGFTPAGVDIYSSRKEGITDGLYQDIRAGLDTLEAQETVKLIKSEMGPITIEL